MTSSVRRIEISLFGFKDRGRPPLLMTPRASISSVNSGSSSYSSGWMTCAATLDRSEPKDRRDTRLLSVICFPHAEDVAIRATRRVANHHHSVTKHSKADDSLFAVVPTQIFRLERRACEDKGGNLKVKASRLLRFGSLRRVIGDCHVVSVSTSTSQRNWQCRAANDARMSGELMPLRLGWRTHRASVAALRYELAQICL